MMRALLLVTAIALSACGVSRKWFIQESNPITGQLPGVGSIDFVFLKQQTDFVHAIIVLHNTSGANLYWKPIGAATSVWGFNLKPLVAGVTVRRDRRDEAGMLIPPGGEARIQAQWFVSPEQPSNDWPWELTIDGLKSGETELPQQRISMPAYTEWPTQPRGGN